MISRATFLLGLALALAGCSNPYRVGDRILVEWEGNDYPASILVIESPGRFRVHYEGYESIWDESIPATRIKGKVKGHVIPPPPPPRVRARMSPGNKTTASTFRQGDRVKVDWKNTLYPATIVEVLGNERYRVHYDGYDANWDENVDFTRIHRRLQLTQVTRRDFLASVLGLAVAQSACRRPWQKVPGEIRGASAAVGHRLRTPQQLGEPTRTERTRVLIVGAGPSGLSAGWRLAQLQESDFLVVDLEREEGGTSAFGRDGVVPYPWGAHYVPVPRAENEALLTLLREMNAIEGVDARGEPIPTEGMVVRDPEERLFLGGTWHEGLFPRHGASGDDLAQLTRFQREVLELSRRRDGRGRRPFTIPMERGSDDPVFTELDRQSMARWLADRGYTSERLRWYVDYACRDDYGLLARDTSAWAGLFYFASRLGPDGSEAAPLFTWTNGNGRLVEHLSRAVGKRKRTGHLIVDVATVGDHVEALALDLARNEVVRFLADRAIFAAPKFLAPRLLRQARDERPAWPGAFVTGAWMVANLHLKDRPSTRGAPMAWDNVLYDSPSLGYVVATHQAQIDEGATILSYYLPYTDSDAATGRRRLFEADHGQLADLVLADLGQAHSDLSSLVTRLDVMRWGHAMVQPRPGFVWGPDRRAAALPLGRIHMAHSDLSGLALFEESLHHGVRSAEEVALALGHPLPHRLG